LFVGNKRVTTLDIWWGQYLGIALLVTISYFGARLGRWIDIRYIGLLGFVPIYLGIRQFSELFHRSEPEVPSPVNKKIYLSQGFWAVASITFSNGGDIIVPKFLCFQL